MDWLRSRDVLQAVSRQTSALLDFPIHSKPLHATRTQRAKSCFVLVGHSRGLTDILYQWDREFIALLTLDPVAVAMGCPRPDLRGLGQ
jgi:hypothetical protein